MALVNSLSMGLYALFIVVVFTCVSLDVSMDDAMETLGTVWLVGGVELLAC